MADRAPNEVWIERVSKGHCYVRKGNGPVEAAVLYPHDSEEAETVRQAFEQLFASRANGDELLTNKGNK